MARGKHTCRILKEIRRQIADANDIEYITSECTFKGDCSGTCPKCESELRYLERQLALRQAAGKAITLIGLSASIIGANAIPANTPVNHKNDDCATVNAIKGEMSDNRSEKAFTVVGGIDQMPASKGGDAELMKLISARIDSIMKKRNIDLDKYDIAPGNEKVIIRFGINEEGKVVETALAPESGKDLLLTSVVTEAIHSMPKWIPPVNPSGITWLTLPVIFSNTRKQDSSIHGKVIDVNGIPIIGASIKAMDTGVHSVTDMNGNFSISITDGSILTVRYVGMKTQEVPVSIGSGPLTITLQEDVTPLMGEMVSTKTSATSAGGSSILDVVPDIDLEFPGGETALKKKLYENIDSILNERGIDIKSRIDIKGQTRILLQFIINKDGSIGEVSIALGLDEELNSVAIEAMKRLPHFIVPENARQHWSSRPIRYTIPVIFNPDKTIQQR